MEYKLTLTGITTLRPYMFAAGGGLLGCVVGYHSYCCSTSI